MKITRENLRRELAGLDGLEVVEMNPGRFMSRTGKGMYAQYATLPDYLNDLNACFVLALKLGFEIELIQYDVYSTATVTNHVLARQGWAMEDNPRTAASLAILSAHRGERVKLEDNDGT